jgi:cardiolipin synthase
MLLLALACSGCATPKLQSLPSPAPVPPIVAPSGALSEKAAERLLDSRLGEPESDPHVRELVDSVRQYAATPFVAGNRVTLLIDGPQTLAAMRKAVQEARHHIHLETYIFADDEVGRAFRDLLIQRRHDGLTVRVLYDAVGNLGTSPGFFVGMREAGIEVREFRPLNPLRTPLIWKHNNRDHRKILLIDGRIAFTGGINISSTYASSSATRPGPKQGVAEAWRDTHLMIEGPVAGQFQSLFFAGWTAAGGEADSASTDYFPPQTAVGRELIAAVATDGNDPDETTIYSTYLSVVEHSTRRIWLTNAYFAPNKELRDALIAAAKRGVDVRLIVPGFTDSRLILYASRASFDELLAGGVRIYEQRSALLHAKTAVIDSALSMVGSSNLDMRSFLHNNEVNAVVIGEAFAARLELLFQQDLKNTTELQLDTWRQRSLLEKLKEFGASRFNYWL